MSYGVDTVRPAVVTIDLHRGHLDPAVATLPLPPDIGSEVIAANRAFLAECRRASIPVVHLITRYLDARESSVNPFWHAFADDPGSGRRNQERHNIAGSPGCEIIPDVYDPEYDWILSTKRRYNCFQGTDLDLVLRAHDINAVLLTGVNTNSCVLATATAACSLDYAVVAVSDCVATMDGPELHDAALRCIATAFGWVSTSAQLGREMPSWAMAAA